MHYYLHLYHDHYHPYRLSSRANFWRTFEFEKISSRNITPRWNCLNLTFKILYVLNLFVKTFLGPPLGTLSTALLVCLFNLKVGPNEASL